MKWNQLFTDVTSRRQVSFQALLVGVMDDGGLIDPVVVSSCFFHGGRESETEAQCVIDKVCCIGIQSCLYFYCSNTNFYCFID